MIIVDTNVISELVRERPDPAALAWVREYQEVLASTAVTVQELRYGVEVLPEGRRKRSLEQLVEQAIDALVKVYDYDQRAARHAARILAEMKAQGRRLAGPEDAQILGIARAAGLAVATRNAEHFRGWGVDIIDPWRQPPT